MVCALRVRMRMARASPSLNVLIANIPEGDARLRECLSSQRLRFVHTMREALLAMQDEEFDLVVVGLHFDESRMFELLLHIRSLDDAHGMPVVCVHTVERNMPPGIRTNIEVAAMALGAMAFLDLRGEGEAFAQQREILRQIAANLARR